MLRKERGKSSTLHRGKSAAKRYIVKRTGKCSKRGRERKGCQENIQNLKRNIVRHWNRKGRYAQRHNSKSTLR